MTLGCKQSLSCVSTLCKSQQGEKLKFFLGTVVSVLLKSMIILAMFYIRFSHVLLLNILVLVVY